MSKKKNKSENPVHKLPIEFLEDENSTASVHECTGLIPRGITTRAESESYEELYNVYQPDSTLVKRKDSKKP